MKKTVAFCLLSGVLFHNGIAQSLAINTTGATASPSAILDVTSTTKGVLIARMTTAQRTAIASPATGLMVFDTNTASLWTYSGSTWVQVSYSTTAWGVGGNSTVATNFIGTTNAQPLRFFCNNAEKMRFDPTTGSLNVGATAGPYAGSLLAGMTTASNTFALNGFSSQNGSGMWGEVLAGNTTVYSGTTGIYAGSGTGAGLLGNNVGTNTSNTRAGVYGFLSTNVTGGAGVSGYSSTTAGNQHMGVLGWYNGATYGLGVYGIGYQGGIIGGDFDIAVVGWRASNSNYSGYFNGNHVIANGTKSASVGTQWGNQLLYCTESPEVWFEDIGRATLVNGKCTIELDGIFKQVTVIDSRHPMHVFVQPEGESEDLYVIPGTTSFTVKEKRNGASNISFSYRIMAKRVNFQDHRYGNDPVWGAGDTRPYMQYATPPSTDYNTNLQLQLDQRRNYKQPPMPAGFVPYDQLMKEMNERVAGGERKND